ncbi:hypothetical protein RKD37_004133 [Streptomyces ambofaciens]
MGQALDAQAAQDAAGVVDLVDAAVPLARRVALLVGVVRALDVDGVGGAGPGAQLAADALLQAVRMAVELVPSVEARSGGLLLLRVLLGQPLLEHGLEGHAEAGHGVHETGVGPPVIHVFRVFPVPLVFHVFPAFLSHRTPPFHP